MLPAATAGSWASCSAQQLLSRLLQGPCWALPMLRSCQGASPLASWGGGHLLLVAPGAVRPWSTQSHAHLCPGGARHPFLSSRCLLEAAAHLSIWRSRMAAHRAALGGSRRVPAFVPLFGPPTVVPGNAILGALAHNFPASLNLTQHKSHKPRPVDCSGKLDLRGGGRGGRRGGRLEAD